jgi:RNA polymerase sigma-70 factor, ECF subfamily
MADYLSDEEIVRLVLSGDVDAYREIVKRYQDVIYGIGYRFFRNKEDSVDFAQEILVKSYISLETYKGRAPFKYWLIKIAYNAAVTRKKSIRIDEPLEFPDRIQSSAPTPSGSFEDSEMKSVLLSAIGLLPEEYRVCVDLFFFSGFSYPRISQLTGIPVGTIKSNVYRAKCMLRELLRGTIAEDYHEM